MRLLVHWPLANKSHVLAFQAWLALWACRELKGDTGNVTSVIGYILAEHSPPFKWWNILQWHLGGWGWDSTSYRERGERTNKGVKRGRRQKERQARWGEKTIKRARKMERFKDLWAFTQESDHGENIGVESSLVHLVVLPLWRWMGLSGHDMFSTLPLKRGEWGGLYVWIGGGTRPNQ